MANFRYSLTQAPEARNDGSGCVDHQITAEYDDGDGWLTVPARNKTFSLPATELAVVMAMNNGAAKVSAYKQLLVDNLNTQPVPITGWAVGQLQEMVDANKAALSAGTAANTYITVTLNLDYPVPFTI